MVVYFAVDKGGDEWVYYDVEPIRIEEDEEIGFWLPGKWNGELKQLEKGTIKKLIGEDLIWYDEPYKTEIDYEI